MTHPPPWDRIQMLLAKRSTSFFGKTYPTTNGFQQYGGTGRSVAERLEVGAEEPPPLFKCYTSHLLRIAHNVAECLLPKLTPFPKLLNSRSGKERMAWGKP